MGAELDAYRILQVVSDAETSVLQAAYRALARRYHPDGETPDPARMAAVNRAYALVRSPELRALYDLSLTGLRPMGPGAAERGSVPPPVGPDGAFARAAARSGRPAPPGSTVLDFGRYAGWSIAQLARHDPDYLRWLCRHSAGLRFRAEIQQYLGHEPDLNRRAGATA